MRRPERRKTGARPISLARRQFRPADPSLESRFWVLADITRADEFPPLGLKITLLNVRFCGRFEV